MFKSTLYITGFWIIISFDFCIASNASLARMKESAHNWFGCLLCIVLVCCSCCSGHFILLLMFVHICSFLWVFMCIQCSGSVVQSINNIQFQIKGCKITLMQRLLVSECRTSALLWPGSRPGSLNIIISIFTWFSTSHSEWLMPGAQQAQQTELYQYQ